MKVGSYYFKSNCFCFGTWQPARGLPGLGLVFGEMMGTQALVTMLSEKSPSLLYSEEALPVNDHSALTYSRIFQDKTHFHPPHDSLSYLPLGNLRPPCVSLTHSSLMDIFFITIA